MRRTNSISRPSRSSNSLSGGSCVAQEQKHAPKSFFSFPLVFCWGLLLADFKGKGAREMHFPGTASWGLEQGREDWEMNIEGKQNNQDRGSGKTKETCKVRSVSDARGAEEALAGSWSWCTD